MCEHLHLMQSLSDHGVRSSEDVNISKHGINDELRLCLSSDSKCERWGVIYPSEKNTVFVTDDPETDSLLN